MSETGLNPWRSWKARRQAEAENRLVEDTFAEAFGRPNARQIRKWKDRELHAWLVSNDLQPVERSIAERELVRRQAWEAPAGRAVIISISALVVSMISLAAAAIG